MQPTADQQIDELIARHEASWRLGYSAFPAVLNRLGLKRGAEIGVAFGGHSEAILQNTAVDRLYAIDSYKHRPEYDDPMNLPQPVFDRLFERTGERLSVFGDRVRQVRLDSVQAAQQIKEPLDFVYIDGDHSYQGIRADLEAWFPRVREGGIVAGHDYGQPAFPGVKAAADQFFKRFGIAVTHEGKGVWWAQRPATAVTVVIALNNARFSDATLYDRLKSAGLSQRDHVILVHDDRHACDAVSRVLGDHPALDVKAVTGLRGPWHGVMSVIDNIQTAMAYPITVQAPPAHNTIHTLRDRLSTSGAIASALTPDQRTNDFALAQLLATSSPPIAAGQLMMTTHAMRQAHASLLATITPGSDRLIPWLVLADALAGGGRVALEPGPVDQAPMAWTAQDCRLSARALAAFAPQIDGADLIRLKWSPYANGWLNSLGARPIRTRANIRPLDAPPVYTTPGLLDRVVHKFRRSVRGAA